MFNLFKRQGLTDLQWMKTDVHSHILPGIDDGVKDVQTSIEFIKTLRELGLKQFILTPHIYDEVYPNTPQTINLAHENLYAEMQLSGMGDVYTHSSAEYMLGQHFDSLLTRGDLRPFPTDHLLIEMPWSTEPFQLEQTILKIVEEGYAPIMAHPERYHFYFHQFNGYDRLKDLGCILQLNLLSPTGYYGRDVTRAAQYLIKNNLYDLVGTDLHHERQLGKIIKYVKDGKAHKDLRHLNLRNEELF
ncbi:tyrosine-protein phosphatase [Olivibacter domesticus]|nr:CpsB/CapC family capsule biosynthesis tyrosine phosphatase [Olivibacter domesticus]